MKLAFVVQRYGVEVSGGSEYHCRMIAELLSKHFDVEVITTCALDYTTWENYYPEGEENLNGVIVRRFPVDKPRDIRKFNSFSEKVLLNPHTREDEIKWMKLQGPYSTKLIEFIKENRNNFDFFIFFTYLYCTTFFGLPIVKEKAILVPTAHDEPPIRLSIFTEIFQSPRLIIYNTPEEKEFVNLLFRNDDIPSEVVGLGVNPPKKISGDRFRSKYKIKSPFILYIGRIDESKGCGELFEYFSRYKKEEKSDLKLVLIGKAVMKIPKRDDIIHMGFLEEEDKYDAIVASELLVMPSKYESLSIVLLEAWSCGVPVLANAGCEVLKAQCLRSNGGLWYENYDEFKECLNLLLSDKELRRKLGENGRRYVQKNYSWDVIEKKFLKLLKKFQNAHQ
jgi:glycosyltransferase involved in cell wall biosynthesis